MRLPTPLEEAAVPLTRSGLGELVRRARSRGEVRRPRSVARRVPDEARPPAVASDADFEPDRVAPEPSHVARDTVIVATTVGGETFTSRPMPKIQAEMLLVLGVRGGSKRVRPTGIARASMRRALAADDNPPPPFPDFEGPQ